MLTKRNSLNFVLLVLVLTSTVPAQRPRAVTNDGTPPPAATTPTPAPAPATVKAKYEGGVFGYPNKKNGKLSLDEPNKRLVFGDDKKKEIFSIPYGSITGAYGDTHAVQPAAASVASHVPYVGLPAAFIKTKVRYLTVQYNDPDSNASGATSFRLENKELLDSVLNTLATNAGLTRRGEIFVRKKDQ
jgi:hypothetical protein